MSLTHLPLAQIDESHLRTLIAIGAAESLHIEYKRDTYGTNDESRREFLADVSSFANTSGGDLVIGVVASKGIPTALHPYKSDAESERLRLEQMARDGLQPRIGNLSTRAVQLSESGAVIILRVPKSFMSPHRIIFKNSGRFWARSSAGKYEPNTEELRRVFMEAPLLAEHIRAFRSDRIARIAAGDTPVTLAQGTLLIVHLVPFSAFDVANSLSIETVEKDWLLFPPLGRNRPNHRYVNFDGFITLSHADPKAPEQSAYTQVFRSGAIESVANVVRPDGRIEASRIDKYCVATTKMLVQGLAKFGIGTPIAVLASLIHVSGREIVTGIDNLEPPYGEYTIRSDRILFSEVILESVPANYTETAALLKRLLEQIWNTAGFPQIESMDASGKWLFGN